MQVLLSKALDLVQDQFGNYVIQHVLSHCPQQIPGVVSSLRGSISKLCVQKFSSNVIEKVVFVTRCKLTMLSVLRLPIGPSSI